MLDIPCLTIIYTFFWSCRSKKRRKNGKTTHYNLSFHFVLCLLHWKILYSFHLHFWSTETRLLMHEMTSQKIYQRLSTSVDTVLPTNLVLFNYCSFWATSFFVQINLASQKQWLLHQLHWRAYVNLVQFLSEIFFRSADNRQQLSSAFLLQHLIDSGGHDSLIANHRIPTNVEKKTSINYSHKIANESVVFFDHHFCCYFLIRFSAPVDRRSFFTVVLFSSGYFALCNEMKWKQSLHTDGRERERSGRDRGWTHTTQSKNEQKKNHI